MMLNLKEGMNIVSMLVEDEETVLNWAREIGQHVGALEKLINTPPQIKMAATVVTEENQ